LQEKICVKSKIFTPYAILADDTTYANRGRLRRVWAVFTRPPPPAQMQTPAAVQHGQARRTFARHHKRIVMPKEVKVSAANEHRQERRASARRGQRIVMPKEVRVLAAIEHRQERRVSARRGSADTFTQTQGRLLGKPPTVCGPITVAIACGVHATGGLRPPLLVARRLFAVKSGICGAKTHVHKSGGRQPAVACETRWSCESTRNGSRRARGA
jgi:hypothetical protein